MFSGTPYKAAGHLCARRVVPVFLLISCLIPRLAFAGGGPQNLLIVVNEQSQESLELGKYYQQQRGVPERNIFRISVTPTNNMTMATFSNDVRSPILGYISSSGLSNQVQVILFSSGIPYRIGGTDTNLHQNAITAAMFYGFKNHAWNSSPQPPTDTYQDYYTAERHFMRDSSPVSNRYYLSALITGTNLARAKTLVQRAVEADYLRPTGTVYMFHTLDPRNIQWLQFDNLDFLSRFLEIPRDQEYRDGYLSWPMTNVMGVMLGQLDAQVGGYIRSSTYGKGALAEHLTSYGGALLDPWISPYTHTRIMHWLEAGAAGSYGTVVEPYALTNKFPEPRLHYWYGRGFSLAESYFMAVQTPFQGVLVGDPLCSPYAVPPGVALGGITNNETVSGVITVTVSGVSADTTRPLDQLEVYMDGMWAALVTNVVPASGNVVTVRLNGVSRSYTVAGGDTIYDVAAAIADRINLPPPLIFSAAASGDRVEVKQKTAGLPGQTNTCLVSASQGAAGESTLFAHGVYTNFLESRAQARKLITLSGTPASGDVVRIEITTLGGLTVTNTVVSEATNDTGFVLLSNLVAAVNSNPLLQGTDGCQAKWVYKPRWWDPKFGEAYLVARTNGWAGYSLSASVLDVKQPGSGLTNDNVSGIFSHNEPDLTARAQIFVSAGRTNLAADYVLDTTTLPDGPHEILVVAREGTAVGTQGRLKRSFVVKNHDLTCAITNLDAVTYAVLGQSLEVHVAAEDPGGTVTNVEFRAEGKWVASSNSEPYSFSLETALYGIGPVTLQAQAFSDQGKVTLSEPVILNIAETNWITVTTGDNGTIHPSGNVLVARGSSPTFDIQADTYYSIAQLQTNSAIVPGYSNISFAQFTWSNVVADGSLYAAFSANLATQGVPHWWLASFNLPTNDAAALDDPDEDEYFTWQEYYADTDPTNDASFFPPIGTAVETGEWSVVAGETSTGRLYDVYWKTNLLPESLPWLPYGLNLSGTGSNLLFLLTNDVDAGFYRVGVKLP